MLLVIFGVLLFILMLFILVDVYVAVDEWQRRIHIGRWNDRKQWQQAVKRKAVLWLRHTPTVRKTAQNRLILIDMLRGDFRNTTIQTWQDAGLLMGLDKCHVEQYLLDKKDLFVKSSIMPEDLLLAYAVKKHDMLTEIQESHILSSFQKLKDHGTILYRPWVKTIRFVDTLGMVLPFMHACRWDQLVERQLKEYDAALYDGLYPAHAYNLDKQLPLGVFDWCRGIGWYVLALTETSDIEGHAQRILALSEALLKHQNPDGGFSSFVFNPKERMDSSGTALIGLLFIEAYKFSKDDKYIHAACQVEKALMKSTRRDGALDNCQGDTYGIGHYSRVFSLMPFAQGMALLLSKRIDVILNENA